ncbi:hypothetical protein HNQ92_005437 [Rhabdobacter roseus]|uniref:G8 domain-containing protein n=1 Tax=Rhabdobacter roseus TaxID=1655419 RepID=A0A840TVJ8_9BACT|nr:sialate O-acetylesterase [Rhabdobacter roseus]MBB5287274.1 hypothetical protein [Rhabdobacter roseus]
MFRITKKNYLLGLALLGPLSAWAQLTVSYPANRAVFQRNNANQATVYVAGYHAVCLDRVEARFVPRAAGQGTAVDWFVVQDNPQGGHFYGSRTVLGGWYRLEVRGVRNDSVIVQDAVERVGVGEVFVVAGQSNATGGDGLPNGPGATDDRVNSVDFQNLNQQGPISYADTQLPFPVFVHFDAPVKPAPFGNYAWCWAAFGDVMAAQLNVPILIFNAGWSGSGIRNWRESIPTNANSVSDFGYPYPSGMPFGHLRLALNYYVAQQGCRAVLWHQGETDNYANRSREDYRSDLRTLVETSRSLSGKNNLAWVVARASRFTVEGTSRTWQPVIDAQNDVAGVNGTSDPNVYLPYVFPGPETDPLIGPDYRTSDEVHFTGNGLMALAQAWAGTLPMSFFTTSSTPYQATPLPPVSVACGGSTLTFTAPAGVAEYRWHPATDITQVLGTNQQYNAASGQYRLRQKNATNNTVFSATLSVPASLAVGVSASGTSQVPAGGTINLFSSATNACGVSWTGPNGFSSQAANPTLPNASASQAGIYQVTARNVYGCQSQSTVSVAVSSSTSGSWSSPSTWNCGCLPTAATNVVISAGHLVTVDAIQANARSVEFQGGTLQFANGGNLLLNQ